VLVPPPDLERRARTTTIRCHSTRPTRNAINRHALAHARRLSTKTFPAETPPSGTGPQLDEERAINVALPTGSETIQAKAIAVGKSAVVWADITPAHPAVLDPTEVQAFLTDFENIILPRARTIFGVESDLDTDGHIGLVFTPLTYQTAVAFFISCDLKLSICRRQPGGVPPTLNAIDPPYNTPNAIKKPLARFARSGYNCKVPKKDRA
jgi:hypothetical protein